MNNLGIKVVNVKHLPAHWQEDPTIIYVGRANPRHGLEGHPLANPFKIGRDGSRDKVIEKYLYWLSGDQENINKLTTLGNQMLRVIEQYGEVSLACWCAPERCHCDVIKHAIESALLLKIVRQVIEEIHEEETDES